MAKRTQPSSDKHSNIKSLYPSGLLRQPIHKETEEEENKYNEEIESNPKKLYPEEDLKEELEEIKEQKYQNESKRLPKHQLTQKRDQFKQVVNSNKETKSSDFCTLKYILFLIFSIVAIFLGIGSFGPFSPEKTATDKSIDLEKFISDMKNKFEEQNLETFHILKISLKKVLKEHSEPAAPSVVTIITNKGAEIIASDFSKYIAQELAYEHYVSINESTFHRNPDNLKYVIDTDIKSKFDNRSLNVVVVDRLHNIPIGAAMIFHNYCDHENAPFKRAIFLFIVHLNRKIPENSSVKFRDSAAMEALRSIWHDTSDDIVDSLITRLTVNVINIK